MAHDGLPVAVLHFKRLHTRRYGESSSFLQSRVTLCAVKFDRLDHLVLTVRNIDSTVSFYEQVLGMERIETGASRIALAFGEHRINLHESGNEFAPHATRPTPGSADICFVTSASVDEILSHLVVCGVEIELGPVERGGARGTMKSVYFRDPDGNLIEASTYENPPF